MADVKDSLGKAFSRLNENVAAAEGKWIKGALKTAGEHLNPFDKLGGESERRIKGFGRIAGVTLGGAMVLDGVFRGKTSDGEDRSVITRLGEIVVGSGVAGMSALAGGLAR